jgi:hypothetical protein
MILNIIQNELKLKKVRIYDGRELKLIQVFNGSTVIIFLVDERYLYISETYSYSCINDIIEKAPYKIELIDDSIIDIVKEAYKKFNKRHHFFIKAAMIIIITILLGCIIILSAILQNELLKLCVSVFATLQIIAAYISKNIKYIHIIPLLSMCCIFFAYGVYELLK